MTISDIKMVSGDNINHLKTTKSEALPDKEEARLREASKKLEGQFLTFLVKSMEKTVHKEDNSNNMAAMMFSTVMGEQMAENGGIGMAEFIYQSLKQNGTEALDRMGEGNNMNPFITASLPGGLDE